ncbi:MAG: lipopolysaccharide biosynthesis protein [Algoriphagus aquaeductus]|uniref:lipopolysaccharide biosynthesis protein n=1 Tax=Algoriphagus aquaeductus TaxID=475299 RepID=UPI00391D2FD2
MSLHANIKRLLSDSVIYGLSGVFTRFISVFLTPIYTRIYTPEDYGVIGILTNGYILLSILLVFSMDAATARWYFDTESKEQRKRVINTWIWFYLIFSLAVGVLLFVTAGFWQQQFLPESPDSILFIRLISLNLPLVVWSTVAINILRFELKAKKSVFLSLSQSLLLIFFNILFVVLLRMGLQGIYWAQLAGSLLVVPLSLFFIKEWVGYPKLFSKDLFPGMLKFAFPLMPATIGYWVVNLSGVFFINEFLPQEKVGLYQIGISVASVSGLATTAFQQAWSPFAFSILNQPNAKQVFAFSLKVYVLLVGLFCMLIAVFAFEALVILTTEAYYGAALVASILTFNSFLMGLSTISGLGATVAKKTFPLGMINLVSAILLIGFNFALIPVLGIEGAALAVCLSQLIIPCYMFWKSHQYYAIPFPFLNSIFLVLLMVGTVTLSYLFKQENVWFNFVLKSGLVIFALVLMGWMNKTEVSRFFELVKKSRLVA